MSGRRTITLLLFLLAAMMLVIARAYPPRADEEEEEKPIASRAARVSRDAVGSIVIEMGRATQKEVGIATDTLKPALLPVKVEAYGFILDPGPLSKLNADLTSAQASLDASSAQYRRTKRLYAEQKNASLRDLQAAEASYLNDKAHLETLEQQLRDSWGREIAQISSKARGEFVAALIDRREAIAHVTAPMGEQLDSAPGRADVFVLGHEQHPLRARAVYEAPTTGQLMQGQTFLLLISTQDFPIKPGTALSARIPASGKSEQGVVVPREAVVRFGGKEWVYREFDGDHFVRVEIEPAKITARGYFVPERLVPEMPIVIRGAQTLLSEELKAQIQPGD